MNRTVRFLRALGDDWGRGRLTTLFLLPFGVIHLNFDFLQSITDGLLPAHQYSRTFQRGGAYVFLFHLHLRGYRGAKRKDVAQVERTTQSNHFFDDVLQRDENVANIALAQRRFANDAVDEPFLRELEWSLGFGPIRLLPFARAYAEHALDYFKNNHVLNGLHEYCGASDGGICPVNCFLLVLHSPRRRVAFRLPVGDAFLFSLAMVLRSYWEPFCIPIEKGLAFLLGKVEASHWEHDYLYIVNGKVRLSNILKELYLDSSWIDT